MVICAICLEEINVEVLRCGHLYHPHCVHRLRIHYPHNPRCPQCRAAVNPPVNHLVNPVNPPVEEEEPPVEEDEAPMEEDEAPMEEEEEEDEDFEEWFQQVYYQDHLPLDYFYDDEVYHEMFPDEEEEEEEEEDLEEEEEEYLLPHWSEDSDDSDD